MGQTMRVSLPGYNAGTDTNPDHYALYADEDNILIKEKQRGTINISPGGIGTISHSLGYIPYIIVAGNFSGKFGLITGGEFSSVFPAYSTLGTSVLKIYNNGAGTTTFHYYIFYDDISI